jgi:repressor LexA
MEIGEMIKKRREKLGFSQRQLAYLSGVSNTEIKRIEDGDRKQPSQEILCKLANPLRVKKEELFKAAGYYVREVPDAIPVEDVVKIPIYGEIRAGDPMLACEEAIGYEYITSEEVRGGEYFFLRVKGDSMIGARIHEGDLVLVRKQPALEEGQIGVFMIEGEATIKTYHQQGNIAILTPENSEYKPVIVPLKNLVIVGEVVEAKIKFNGR